MSISELIIEIIAYAIAIGIVILPFYIGIKIIKAISKSLKKKKNHNKQNKTRIIHQDTEFHSEWIWVEERKLWVHKSEIEREQNDYRRKATPTNVDGTYHYKGVEIADEWIRIARDNIRKQEQVKQAAETKPKYQSPKQTQQANAPYSSKTTQRVNSEPQNKATDNSKYKNAYEARPVLTQNEMQNYRTLYEAASRKGYIVNAKMRLADIVKPRNDPQYMSRFGKIKSKHVDFVILDMNMRIKAIIELDDSSHDRKDRKERDEFVDTILQDCGFKIIHTRYIAPDILDGI